MEKKYKEDPLSPKETTPKETDPPELESAAKKDHGSEKQSSTNVSEPSLMQSDTSSPDYLESDTTKDNDTEKQDSAAEGQQGDMAQDVITIEVRGLNAATVNETIESFFESTRKSGGGDIKNIEIGERNEVVQVTYWDPRVAENVLRMPELKLEGAMLTVSPVPKWDRKTIEVRGLHPTTSYDAIELFFESKRRSGGDIVEDMYLDTDNNIAYVMFESPEAAENVLTNNLLLEGATLTVQPKLSIPSRHQTTQRDNGNEKEQKPQVHDQDSNRQTIEQGGNECDDEFRVDIPAEGPQGNMHQDVCTIEVRGFNADTYDETIEAFFENRRCSGGGEIKDTEFDKRNKVVRVTYCDPRVAENVLRKPELKLEGATLTVSPVEKWDRKTIEVCGLRPNISQDAIVLFFESKRRSGGGVVEDMHLNTDTNIAYVTFESPEAAENVLKNNHKLEGATLTVRSNLSKSSRHQSTQREMGNEKGHDQLIHDHDSDGLTTQQERDESMEQPSTRFAEPGGGAVIGTRESPRKHDETLRDAQTPTRSPCDTPVEPHKRASPQPATPPVAPRNVILVSGIKDTTTEEVFKLFFENKKRSGGGTVKDLDYRLTEGQATITFHSDKDAQRVVQHGALKLNGADLTTKLMVEDPIQETTYTPTSSCATTDMSSSHILEICGFKPGTTRESIEMFIENKSGETDLQSLDYDTTKCIAIVSFKNAEGATHLMSVKNLLLDGAQLSVNHLVDIYARLDRESCRPRAIKVEGIGKGTTEELLQLLFENRRKSGGGDIQQLDYDTEEDTAVIVFQDADTAERVAQKEQLMINDSRVQMKLMKPPMSLPVLQGPFVENQVLVSGLSPNCTGDDLKTFFSAEKTHSEIQHVIFSLHPGVAVLQFTHPPEFDRLGELCVTKPLRRSMLSVQKVQKSKAIQVHNIGDINEMMLSLYFESKRNGGAEVTDIQVFREDDYAIIAFEEWANVQNILAKGSHEVNKQTLRVAPYFDCLGVIPPYHNTTMPGGWIPKNVVVTGFSPRVFNFLQTSGVSRQLVDAKMAEVAAVVEWDTHNDASTCVELTCVISHTMKDAQTKAKTWSQDVSKAFLDVLAKHFETENIETLQEAWQMFLGCTGYVSELGHSEIVVEINNDACSICITGPRNEVENLSTKLSDDHSKVQEEMTRAATRVTETTSGLKLHQLRMLNAMAFKSQQQRKFAHLTVEIDMKAIEIKLSGMPVDVMQAKLEMFEMFAKMTEQLIEMSSLLITMLNGKEMRKHVVDQFKNQNICAVFSGVGGNQLGVYALSDNHLCTAIDVIKDTTCDTSVVADKTKMAAPQKWTELIKNQQSKHGGLLSITVDGNTVLLVGAKSRMEVALEEIKTFLKDNIISEQFVSMEHGVARYIDTYMTEEITRIMQDFQHSAVKIIAKLDGPYGYVVSGNSYGLQSVVQLLQKMPDEVKVQQFKVDKPGMPKYLTSGAGQHSIQRLEDQHNVIIEAVGRYAQKGEELASDAGASAAGSSSMSRVTLPRGVTVEVVRGDLTKFHADAIVNAANGRLDHIGGLAKAIADAGGPDIQKECQNHVRRNGEIADGCVYVSTPGRLPCKKVIHAVGPIWKGGHSSEENSLYEAVFESMSAAEEWQFSSIAIPALSSGIFGFPIDKCTLTIISAVKDFLEVRTLSSVKTVSLLDPNEDVVRVFHKTLGTVFGSKVMTTSGDRQVSSQTKAPRLSPRTKTRSETSSPKVYSRQSEHTSTRKVEDAQTQRKQTSTPGKAQLTTAEGITLTLCKSEIAKQQVDVIVNSSSSNLELNQGAVSRSLLQNGGNIIQTECQQNAPNGLQFGEVVVTSGGRLHCQHIVHGACCPWDGRKGKSEQVLKQLLTNCFQAVHDRNLTSVAFPAIGTGQLGFPHRLVATIMLDELHQFSSRNPETSLKDVRFVVYQKDKKTMQAFEEELSAGEPGLQKTASQSARALVRPERGVVGGTISRSISEKSEEMIHIGSIDVDIIHGDLTQEDTDAIVNSSDSNLALQGATSKAIVAAGGPSIVRECKRLGKIGPNGIAVTSGGQLPSTHIIHIDARRSDLTAIIESVLVEADSLDIESVAFPALGTGILGLSPNRMADAMLDAIERFTQQKPESSLKLVKIVIFQQSMMQSFRKCAFKKASGKKGWREGVSAMFGCVKGFFLGDGTTDEESSTTRQHITFNIFGKLPRAIVAAKNAMQQLCEKECKEIILDSETDQASIAKLTPTEMDQIRALEEHLDVKITITKNQPKVCIRIQGIPADTSQANLQIVNIFRQMEHDDKDKTLASMYAKQAHWKYSEGEVFKNYPEAINGLLENAFQSKKDQVEWKEDTGVKYCVTFKTMKETTDRDETGVDVKREDIGGRLELPSHWASMVDDEHVKLELLNSSSQEYKDVESKFLSTAQGTVNAVKKIERVQNPSLYRQYMVRKDELEKRIKQPTAIEHILWHGTSASAIKSINNGGFNRSYCGKNATVYGQGVYFAVGSAYSVNNQYATPDANGSKHVYQACVLTGEYSTGHPSYRVPPPNPAHPDFPFDTVVDSIPSPGIFVIFLDNQAYPEYLITFS